MACAAGQTANPIAELKRRLANSPADDASKWALRWCLMDARQVREAKKLDSPADNRELEELRNSAESFIATGNAADRERVHRIGARLPTDASLAPFVILWSAAAGDTDTAFRFANVVQPGYPTTGIIDYLFMSLLMPNWYEQHILRRPADQWPEPVIRAGSNMVSS